MADVPELMTADQVAEVFMVSGHAVRRWVRDGLMPVIRTPGGYLRFRRADVEALLEPHTESQTVTG